MDSGENLSPYLATGTALLELAQRLESEGEVDLAKVMYLRAIEQGLLIRQLRRIFENTEAIQSWKNPEMN